MQQTALGAGQPFPQVSVDTVNGHQVVLGAPVSGYEWQLIVVYRGAHCPLCTRYLQQLNDRLYDLHRLNIDVVAVSADSLEKAQGQMAEVQPRFAVGYGLNIKQMRALGLYISEPRSSLEADGPFAEPGVFVVNDQGLIQVLDISNAPFARPELDSLVKGLEFIKNPENDYPIRGTYA